MQNTSTRRHQDMHGHTFQRKSLARLHCALGIIFWRREVCIYLLRSCVCECTMAEAFLCFYQWGHVCVYVYGACKMHVNAGRCWFKLKLYTCASLLCWRFSTKVISKICVLWASWFFAVSTPPQPQLHKSLTYRARRSPYLFCNGNGFICFAKGSLLLLSADAMD